MSGACSMYKRQERCITGYGGETCGKEPVRRPRHRLRDNIKIDLRNCMGKHGLDLSGSGWGQVADAYKTVMNLRVP